MKQYTIVHVLYLSILLHISIFLCTENQLILNPDCVLAILSHNRKGFFTCNESKNQERLLNKYLTGTVDNMVLDAYEPFCFTACQPLLLTNKEYYRLVPFLNTRTALIDDLTKEFLIRYLPFVFKDRKMPLSRFAFLNLYQFSQKYNICANVYKYTEELGSLSATLRYDTNKIVSMWSDTIENILEDTILNTDLIQPKICLEKKEYQDINRFGTILAYAFPEMHTLYKTLCGCTKYQDLQKKIQELSLLKGEYRLYSNSRIYEMDCRNLYSLGLRLLAAILLLDGSISQTKLEQEQLSKIEAPLSTKHNNTVLQHYEFTKKECLTCLNITNEYITTYHTLKDQLPPCIVDQLKENDTFKEGIYRYNLDLYNILFPIPNSIQPLLQYFTLSNKSQIEIMTSGYFHHSAQTDNSQKKTAPDTEAPSVEKKIRTFLENTIMPSPDIFSDIESIFTTMNNTPEKQPTVSKSITLNKICSLLLKLKYFRHENVLVAYARPLFELISLANSTQPNDIPTAILHHLFFTNPPTDLHLVHQEHTSKEYSTLNPEKIMEWIKMVDCNTKKVKHFTYFDDYRKCYSFDGLSLNPKENLILPIPEDNDKKSPHNQSIRMIDNIFPNTLAMFNFVGLLESFLEKYVGGNNEVTWFFPHNAYSKLIAQIIYYGQKRNKKIRFEGRWSINVNTKTFTTDILDKDTIKLLRDISLFEEKIINNVKVINPKALEKRYIKLIKEALANGLTIKIPSCITIKDHVATITCSQDFMLLLYNLHESNQLSTFLNLLLPGVKTIQLDDNTINNYDLSLLLIQYAANNNMSIKIPYVTIKDSVVEISADCNLNQFIQQILKMNYINILIDRLSPGAKNISFNEKNNGQNIQPINKYTKNHNQENKKTLTSTQSIIQQNGPLGKKYIIKNCNTTTEILLLALISNLHHS